MALSWRRVRGQRRTDEKSHWFSQNARRAREKCTEEVSEEGCEIHRGLLCHMRLENLQTEANQHGRRQEGQGYGGDIWEACVTQGLSGFCSDRVVPHWFGLFLFFFMLLGVYVEIRQVPVYADQPRFRAIMGSSSGCLSWVKNSFFKQSLLAINIENVSFFLFLTFFSCLRPSLFILFTSSCLDGISTFF